jgi:RNase P protein component
MRRRCREAFRIVVRELGEPSALSLQLLLIPRSSSLKCPFPEIQEDVRNFLSTITYA